MEYKRLGNTGLKVSRICMGAGSFGSKSFMNFALEEEESLEVIRKAYDSGINFFDTADTYSNGDSERILGSALKKLNIPRENVVIATKVYFPVGKQGESFKLTPPPDSVSTVNAKGLSRKHIFDAAEASLQRLQVDYIDLYQIHRWDYDTPIEETMKALNDLVQSGKVRYIGASSMHAWQFAKAQHVAEKNGWVKFVSMQDLYNLNYREEEREMIPLCLDQGVGIIPWSPLSGGDLVRETETDRSQSGLGPIFGNQGSDAEKAIIAKVKEVAENKGVSRTEVALAWLLSKPAVVSPIVGVSKLSHLDQALKAISLKLTEEEIESLEAPYRPRAIVGYQ